MRLFLCLKNIVTLFALSKQTFGKFIFKDKIGGMLKQTNQKQRYFIELAYNGTHYHGWQIQPNALSVQEVLEKGFSTLLRESVQVTGAGRTDTGVHASYYVAHIEVEKNFPLQEILFKINRYLPADIVIFSINPVIPQAHARFSALSRTYFYTLLRRKDPFRQNVGYTFTRSLNIDAMQNAANELLQHSDFTSFSRLHTDVKTNNCRITQARWVITEEELTFVISADRFLRNMVRAIVGTLMEVGLGKRSAEQMKSLIEARERKLAGPSAPASGLFLVNIEYPEEIFDSQLNKTALNPSKTNFKSMP